MSKNGLITSTVIALLVAVGTAWAASQSVAIPAGNSFEVTAVIVPGTNGAEVFGIIGEIIDDQIDLSVGVDTAGGLTINGMPMGTVSTGHRIQVDFSGELQGGEWFADITVTDLDDEMVVAVVNDHQMNGQPTTATAEAEQVLSLTAE